MIEIRLGSATDASAIALVRRDSWQAAYEGIIPAPIIDRATAPGTTPADPPSYRRTLVAEAGEPPAVVGYASFGPERIVASAFTPAVSPGGGSLLAARAAVPGGTAPGGTVPGPLTASPLTPGGLAGTVGELYALYVTPAWWSTGTGRALMCHVLARLRAEAYRRAVLWVLTDNTRARRFYERAGFAPDGGANILTGLGGVREVRYARDL